MAEMPIEQEYDRHIAGIKTQENADGSAEVEIPEQEEGIVENEDGSATVHLEEFKGPAEDEDFYSNLAESVNLYDLDKIGNRYLDLIKKDKEAREKRDKQYEEGIRRTGLGDDAPGGANFMGASRVVHPVMAEACVDFASSAIKELFPPDGPTRIQILGDADEIKTEVAERKRDYMNWQLTEQIEEFRDEQEQLLTQLPLGGSQFMKLWYDEKKRRPCAEFVPIDNILLPFASVNFYTSQRVTEVQQITEWEFNQRVDRGLYRDVNLIRATSEPEETKSEQASNKVEGRQWQDNEDGLRTVYHIYTYLELDDDKRTKGESAPYIMMIDSLEHKILGLYRNWEEGDETFNKLDWLIEFKFIPWRGAYAIGLPHLIGGLSAALTGALRALLDTAHINNSATMLKLKGAKISGSSQQIEVTQVSEIEGAPGVDDVRKIAMPMPFNPPSQVLFELLGWLDTAAKGVVSTSEEKIADINANSPVGTAQALIEQGAKVFSAIHARLHDSQRRVLQVLGRINRWYLDDMKKGDVVADLPVSRDDFKRNSDIVPVSDPHIFSETQRMAQNQAVLQLMTQFPQAFDQNAVITRVLKQMKVPGVNELMPANAQPAEMDASNENAAMALGKSAFAYPDQDQLSHIQAHLDFALDPNLGSNNLIAPQFIPQVLEHVKQHMVLWYTQQMQTYAGGHQKVNLQKYEDSKLKTQIDKVVAIAGQHVKLDSQQTFSGVAQALQQLGQLMQKFAPQPQMDPSDQAVLQASMAETNRRAQRDQADVQLAQQKLQADTQLNSNKVQTDQAIKNQALQTDIQLKQQELAQASDADAARLKTDIAMNSQNNATAEKIKAAQLAHDQQKMHTDLATHMHDSLHKHLGDSNGNY